jgi:hypothetical protein
MVYLSFIRQEMADDWFLLVYYEAMEKIWQAKTLLLRFLRFS